MSTERAWYLGARREEVGEAAILVGDPARVGRIAEHLQDVRFLPENRGLRTITGRGAACRITVSAFGMGAPIAAIVLHELFAIGVRRFLRIGTAMAFAPARPGDFVLAEAALRAEGTSLTYAPLGYPAVAAFDMALALRQRLARAARPWRAGLFASYDGFYTEMFSLGAERPVAVERLRAEIARFGLIAADMETAALLTAGRVLGAATGSLCLATVDGATQAKLSDAELASGERELFEVALDALAALSARDNEVRP